MSKYVRPFLPVSARIIGVEILKATFNTATTCTSGDNGGEDTAMQ